MPFVGVSAVVFIASAVSGLDRRSSDAAHCRHEPFDPSASLGFENKFGVILREVDSLSTECGRLWASALCCA